MEITCYRCGFSGDEKHFAFVGIVKWQGFGLCKSCWGSERPTAKILEREVDLYTKLQIIEWNEEDIYKALLKQKGSLWDFPATM